MPAPPKASFGLHPTKPLHDDDNGILSLGVWRCLQEDPINEVWFRFITRSLQWEFESTQDRVCLFNGLFPHKTRTANGVVKKSQVPQIYHTAYIKPCHEFLSLLLFSEKHLQTKDK